MFSHQVKAALEIGQQYRFFGDYPVKFLLEPGFLRCDQIDRNRSGVGAAQVRQQLILRPGLFQRPKYSADLDRREYRAHDTPVSEDPEEHQRDEKRVLVALCFEEKIVGAVRHDREQTDDPDDEG